MILKKRFFTTEAAEAAFTAEGINIIDFVSAFSATSVVKNLIVLR